VRSGLPYSLVIHAGLLAVVFLFGAHVSQRPVDTRHVIRVRLAELPREETTTPAEEPSPIHKPEPEKPKSPEPRTVPEPVAEVVEPPVENPEPEVETTAADPEAAPPEPALLPTSSEPTAAETDKPFPFAWYLTLIEGRISRHWNPRQLGFRDRAERTCKVHFFIERSGAISRVTLVQGSGVQLFDREALRAVQAAHPLPKLPAKFAARSLGVTFYFTLRSGL